MGKITRKLPFRPLLQIRAHTHYCTGSLNSYHDSTRVTSGRNMGPIWENGPKISFYPPPEREECEFSSAKGRTLAPQHNAQYYSNKNVLTYTETKFAKSPRRIFFVTMTIVVMGIKIIRESRRF